MVDNRIVRRSNHTSYNVFKWHGAGRYLTRSDQERKGLLDGLRLAEEANPMYIEPEM
jgi:hypothetical protein